MRSFFAISLALMAGCGDNMGETGPLADHGSPEGAVEDDGSVARLIPEVCAVRPWPEVVLEDKNLDLAVVPMAQGAAVLHVPKSGGKLSGFLVDARGLIMGGPATGTTIIDGEFTGLSANVVDGRLMVGLTDGVNASVNVIRDDLGDFRKLTSEPASFLGDTTVMYARDTRITTTGGATGLVMTSFDGAWAPMGSEVFARSVPTSMTSAAYGNDAMVAWSTETSCHLQRVASGISSEQNFACRNGRLATDYDARAGELVWEGGDNVMLSNIRPSTHNEIANDKVLAPNATSPRIAFDGHRYWVSYLNVHGDVVVGYLDADDTLVSMAIEGTRPANDAYELAFVNGGVWVYAHDGETGFNATRLCLAREGS